MPGKTMNPNNTWRLIEERLLRETDPLTRRNLELVLKHMQCEARGDIEGVLETLSEQPVYRLFYMGAPYREVGGSIERIRQLYRESLLETDAHRLEHDVVRVIADRDAVYTEGFNRQAYPGHVLAKMGITVDDPDAYYTADCYLSMVWPRDPVTGRLTGEEVWMDRDMFAGIADRKIDIKDILPIAA